MRRAALIGAAGVNAANYFTALERIGIDIVAMIDPNPAVEPLARALGARAYTDASELDDRVDLAIITLPPAAQASVAESMIARGVPVLCEKPVAPTAAAVARLASIVDASGLPFMVAFIFRFSPLLQLVRDLIADGEVGVVREVTIGARYPLEPRTPWRHEQHGGVVRINSIHYLDVIPWLVGAPITTAYAVTGSSADESAEDRVSALLRLSDGTPVQLSCAWWPFKAEVMVDVVGSSARLSLPSVWGEHVLVHRAGGSVETRRTQPSTMSDLFTRLVERFASACDGAEPARPGLAEALTASLVAEAILQSGETGQPVDVAKVTDAPDRATAS